jgi:hypothetical protein
MPQYALAGTLAVYVVLAVLLLSLNIFALWRWWVKAAAIIVTCACVVVSYFTITAMIGWPTSTPLPKRFNLVATRIVEPDRTSGAPGHVYLWVEEINANNVPVGAPRGYEVPYTVRVADDADAAQSKINSGQQILGQTGGTEGEAKQQGKGTGGTQTGKMNSNADKGTLVAGESTAADTIGEGALVNFSNMPAVQLPDKGAILLPEQ